MRNGTFSLSAVMNKKIILSVLLVICFFLVTIFFIVHPKETDKKYIYNYHAVIELTEITSMGKHITIKEEWFKKPTMLRQEIFVPGTMKKVQIFNGKKSWAYFPLSSKQVVFREDFDHTPSFFNIQRVYNKARELFLEQKKLDTDKINGREVYVFEDKNKENDLTNTFKIWFDKTTLFALKWEIKSYDPEGKMIKQEICKDIECDPQIPDDFFNIPRGFKITKEKMFSKTPIIPRIYKEEFTPEYLNQWLSQEKDLNRIIEIDPSNAAYAQLGNLLLIRGEYDRSIWLFKKALEIDPNQIMIHMSLVDAYCEQGEINKAIEWIERAEKLFTQKAFYYYRLGSLYEKAGLIKKAVIAYKQAVDLQQNDLINDRGISYDIIGLKDKYVEAYNRVLKKLREEGQALTIENK